MIADDCKYEMVRRRKRMDLRRYCSPVRLHGKYKDDDQMIVRVGVTG